MSVERPGLPELPPGGALVDVVGGTESFTTPRYTRTLPPLWRGYLGQELSHPSGEGI